MQSRRERDSNDQREETMLISHHGSNAETNSTHNNFVANQRTYVRPTTGDVTFIIKLSTMM